MSKPKLSKNEEVEFTALLEKCTQIMKEDRNVLRTSLKETNNDELLALLRKNKKKLDLPNLQIELRKILNKIKGKTPSQSSLPQPSQQTLEKKPQSSKSNIKPPEKNEKIVEKSPETKLLPPTGKKEEKKENESPVKKKMEKTGKKAETVEKKGESQEKKKQEGEKINGEKAHEKNVTNEKNIANNERAIVNNEKNIVNNEKNIVNNEKNNVNNEKNIVNNEKNIVNNEKSLNKEKNSNNEKNINNEKNSNNEKNINNEKNNNNEKNINNEKNVNNEKKNEKNINAEKNAKTIEKSSSEKSNEKTTDSQDKKQKNIKKMEQLDEVVRENNEKYETPSFKAHQQATFRPSLPEKKKQMIPQNLIINPNAEAIKFLANSRNDLEKQVDYLLNLEVGEFCGEKIELFQEKDNYNFADFKLPVEIQPQIIERKLPPVHEEKTKKAESMDIKPQNNELMISPMKSEKSVQSNRGQQFIRPSVLKTIKFITEKPNINPKIVLELQKLLGFAELPPEVVFDKIIGEVHLSRTSQTYFKYKIEVLVANKEPAVPKSVIDKFFEICDLKQDGFIDLNELGFSLECLCRGVLKPNAIRHIYETFDSKNVGFFKEDDFVISLVNLHEKYGENVDENGLRSLFAHLDEDQKGIMTYWDLYFLKNHELIEELKEVCGIEEAA